ncbi:MAG: hypothetical protein RMX89_33395 [Nostoc sp. DedSLP04]|nr:hypothetical protein [Nostoc sp. DedSLP04]
MASGAPTAAVKILNRLSAVQCHQVHRLTMPLAFLCFNNLYKRLHFFIWAMGL